MTLSKSIYPPPLLSVIFLLKTPLDIDSLSKRTILNTIALPINVNMLSQ